jgi:hypothetical protein
VLTWARFNFGGYALIADSLLKFVISTMDIVPNYSRIKTYPFAGEETERMDQTTDYIGFGWPRCTGMMIFRPTPDGRSFLMITTDVEQPGKISMQHATTLDTVTISVSAPK